MLEGECRSGRAKTAADRFPNNSKSVPADDRQACLNGDAVPFDAIAACTRLIGAPSEEAMKTGAHDLPDRSRDRSQHSSRQSRSHCQSKPFRHARLCSVASADRADLAIWQSPATRLVRHRATRKGFGLADYSDALIGTHPAQNLGGIAPDSLFVVGRHDPFVPSPRLAGLLTAVERNVRRGQVIQLSAGRFKTLVMSGAYQRALFGLEWARKTWLVRWPFNAPANRSTFSSPTSRSTAS